VANADIASPNLEAILAGHRACPNVRGIRQVLNRRLAEAPPYDPLDNQIWVRNFPLLAKYGLSFDLQLHPAQAPAAIRLIQANPETQFVLAHAGLPAKDPDGLALWRSAIRRYAIHQNVAVKISGFGGFDPAWNVASIDPIISELLDSFDVRRCMLGSNFPVEGLVRTYESVWQTYFNYFADFSAAERELLFFRNAARIYRLDLGA
jgi:predicted TIM-barrel fold metal-dependent hydrolase